MSATITRASFGVLLVLGLTAPASGQGTATSKTAPGTAKAKSAQETKKAAGKVNINTATMEELQDLPGIGPARAAEIVKARPFKSVDGLKALKGISAKLYDDLLPRITVGDPAPAKKAAAKEAATKEVLTKKTVAKKSAPAEAAKEDDAAQQLRKKSALPPGKKININTATAEELQLLPGIGPVRSAAIISHRPFEKIEDIMKVEGIKEGVFGHVKEHISVK